MARFNDNNQIPDYVPSDLTIINVADSSQLINGTIDGLTIIYKQDTRDLYIPVSGDDVLVVGSLTKLVADGSVTNVGTLPKPANAMEKTPKKRKKTVKKEKDS